MEENIFSIERFDIILDTEWIGRNFIYLSEVESTNSYLLEEKETLEDGTIAFAEKQSAGRGRLDRTWSSAKGLNLTFSMLFTKKKLIHNINYLNLGSAVVTAQTLENLFALKPALKWPNDVLVNKKKIAGILLDSVSSGNRIKKTVVGIGINLNQAVFHGDFKIEPTSIKIETDNLAEREKVLAEFLNLYETMVNKVLDDPQTILNEWRERCRMIGEEIAIVQNDKTKYGIFEDIDANGNLLLKNKGGVEQIYFGDVSLMQ